MLAALRLLLLGEPQKEVLSNLPDRATDLRVGGFLNLVEGSPIHDSFLRSMEAYPYPVARFNFKEGGERSAFNHRAFDEMFKQNSFARFYRPEKYQRHNLGGFELCKGVIEHNNVRYGVEFFYPFLGGHIPAFPRIRIKCARELAELDPLIPEMVERGQIL